MSKGINLLKKCFRILNCIVLFLFAFVLKNKSKVLYLLNYNLKYTLYEKIAYDKILQKG